MASAAIYLEADEPNVEALGEAVTFTPATRAGEATYEFTVDRVPVTLKRMPSERVSQHLRGFGGFVQQLKDPEVRRQDALERISRIRSVFALVTKPEFDAVPALWPRLCELVRTNGGLIFTFNSIYLSDGTALVGPMRK